jgi:hypothetical protein
MLFNSKTLQIRMIFIYYLVVLGVSKSLHQIRQGNDAQRSLVVINDIQSMYSCLRQNIENIAQSAVLRNYNGLGDCRVIGLALQKLKNFVRKCARYLFATIENQ